MLDGAMADACQAPIAPKSECGRGPTVAEVEFRGKLLRICSGHNMRWRRAETDEEREKALTTPLREGPPMKRLPTFMVPAETERRLREAADDDGLKLNDVGRAALEDWLDRRDRRKK